MLSISGSHCNPKYCGPGFKIYGRGIAPPFVPLPSCEVAERVKTIIVQIGNSDNKLRQAEWADFVQRVGAIVQEYASAIYFFGGPENWSVLQRVCWVFDCEESHLPAMKPRLADAREQFRQESLAFTEGQTEFL